MHDTKRRRKYGWLSERTTLVGELLTITVILLYLGLVFHTLAPSVSQQDNTVSAMPSEATEYATKPDCPENHIPCLIHKYSHKYGVDTDTALRIADCESSMGKNTHNPTSTAKGVYMFLDSTWEYTGGGDVLNERENIERFMMYYLDNKHWWVCK